MKMKITYKLFYEHNGSPFYPLYLIEEVGCMFPTVEQMRNAESHQGTIEAPDFESAKQKLAHKFNLVAYIDADGKVLLSCGRFRIIAVMEAV